MHPDDLSPASPEGSAAGDSVRRYNVEHSANESIQPTRSAASAGDQSVATQTAGRRTPARQRYRSAIADAPKQQPSPVPQRPRSRWIVGLILLAIGGSATFAVWNQFFRYEAFGIITGKTVDVSSPWDGVAKSFDVREGDHVQQGDVLLTIENLELNHQLARVTEDLQIAQAKLKAEMSALKWQSQAREEQSKKAHAEYYEQWGEMLETESTIANMNARLTRYKTANKEFEGVVSKEEIETLTFQRDGLQSKVEKLKLALVELKKRIDVTSDVDTNMKQQFEPQIARIASLTTELERLETQIDQGKIRAPTSGLVVKIKILRGERAVPSRPIVEIVEDGSYEAKVFLSQSHTDLLSTGDQVDLWLKPNQEHRAFRVKTVGDKMESPPESLSRRYAKDEELLPVFLTPTQMKDDEHDLRLGSEVMLLN